MKLVKIILSVLLITTFLCSCAYVGYTTNSNFEKPFIPTDSSSQNETVSNESVISSNDSSTNSDPSASTDSVTSEGKPTDPDKLLNDFVASKKYTAYTASLTDESFDQELSYCITDLNSDGKNELLIWLTDAAPFGTTWLFAVDNNDVSMIFEYYGFGAFRYSPSHNAVIVPPEFRPFLGASYSEFHNLSKNVLTKKFTVGATTDDATPQQEKYFYKDSNTEKDITGGEFLAYFDDAVSFDWIKLSI